MSQPRTSELTDTELVALNNILVKEVTALHKKVKSNKTSSKAIGEESLSGLISLYRELELELKSRALL